MTVTVTHTKTVTVPDFTQADLNAQIALGNYPPGTQLSDVALPSDWNDDHELEGIDIIENNLRKIVVVDMNSGDYTMLSSQWDAACIVVTNTGDGTKTITYPATSDGKVPLNLTVYTGFAGNNFYIKSETGNLPLLITAPTYDIVNYSTVSSIVSTYQSFFNTPINSTNNRGAITSKQFIGLTSTYTLTNTTNTQKLFNSSANGALTVEDDTTYLFECQFSLSSMSATSGNCLFDILGAGTATIASTAWSAWGRDGGTIGTAAAIGGSFTVVNASSGDVITATTATAAWVTIKGILRITTGGTIIPSVGLTTAAAAVVGINSFFVAEIIGDAGLTTIGNWS